jgi:hypothetical protein
MSYLQLSDLNGPWNYAQEGDTVHLMNGRSGQATDSYDIQSARRLRPEELPPPANTQEALARATSELRQAESFVEAVNRGLKPNPELVRQARHRLDRAQSDYNNAVRKDKIAQDRRGNPPPTQSQPASSGGTSLLDPFTNPFSNFFNNPSPPSGSDNRNSPLGWTRAGSGRAAAADIITGATTPVRGHVGPRGRPNPTPSTPKPSSDPFSAPLPYTRPTPSDPFSSPPPTTGVISAPGYGVSTTMPDWVRGWNNTPGPLPQPTQPSSPLPQPSRTIYTDYPKTSIFDDSSIWDAQDGYGDSQVGLVNRPPQPTKPQPTAQPVSSSGWGSQPTSGWSSSGWASPPTPSSPLPLPNDVDRAISDPSRSTAWALAQTYYGRTWNTPHDLTNIASPPRPSPPIQAPQPAAPRPAPHQAPRPAPSPKSATSPKAGDRGGNNIFSENTAPKGSSNKPARPTARQQYAAYTGMQGSSDNSSISVTDVLLAVGFAWLALR